MKRYILFAYDYYYPSGGWNDFIESFDSVEAAISHGKKDLDRAHVVDMATGSIVWGL